ncbi:MAG: lysophospholipid acyltransferase family protein [bacterium]|nr:lysophospholipid acyltransferase family protein [bacterium]MDT8395304.1 lysophospholipid acyltransferase family protein [bacterium]
MDPVTMTGEYESPARETGWLARRWPSLVFHWKMLGIYWRANRLAVSGLYDGDQWSLSSLEVFRNLESVGVRFRIENMDVLRRVNGPCVFVANHMSTLETMVLPCLIQPLMDTTFIAKESLVRFPVFGPVLRTRQPITVGRQDPRDDLRTVLEGGKDRLDGGRSIIVFPQTTRRRIFDPDQFNTIGAKLASRASVPVVPIALKTDAWGVGSLIKDFGPIDPDRSVRIAFGDPLTVRGNGREEHQQVIRFIQGKLEEWERSEQ